MLITNLDSVEIERILINNDWSAFRPITFYVEGRNQKCFSIQNMKTGKRYIISSSLDVSRSDILTYQHLDFKETIFWILHISLKASNLYAIVVYEDPPRKLPLPEKLHNEIKAMEAIHALGDRE